MLINNDLSKPAVVHAAKLNWVPSPAPGVDRRMLYRVGGEVGRATSIVRYAPDSAFPRHTHGGGEEILVLNGVFQDEHGDYPAGSYFRNPPGTSHVPASKDGCTIFVRLWQFRSGDHNQIVRQPGEGRRMAPRVGASSSTMLFEDMQESVMLEDWEPNSRVNIPNLRGLEFLILSGSLSLSADRLDAQSWGRLPAEMPFAAVVGAHGVRIWIKDAPLQHPDVLKLPE